MFWVSENLGSLQYMLLAIVIHNSIHDCFE